MSMERLLAGLSEGKYPPKLASFIRRYIRRETSDEHSQIIATPLLEVFSVEIYPRNYKCDETPCNIRGWIRILDKDDNLVAQVYHRDETDPDKVIPGGGLISLTSTLYKTVIIPRSGYKMQVFLMDDEHVIANSKFALSHTVDPEFKMLNVVQANEEDGSDVVVRYTTFQFAVVASIEEIILTSRVAGHQGEGLFDHAEDICATIVACYRNDDALDNQINRLKEVKLETPIALSKTEVVVPAYASLVLRVQLMNRSTKEVLANAFVTKEACQTGHDLAAVELKPPMETKLEHFAFHNCNLQVRLRWRNIHEIATELGIGYGRVLTLDPNKDDEKKSEGASESIKHNPKKPRVDSYQASDVMMDIPSSSHPSVKLKGVKMVEVFSVFVGPNNVSRVHGTIKIEDNRHKMFIFKKGKDSSPEEVSPNTRLLAINGPCHSIDGHFFNLKTDLKDEDGCVVSKGGKMMWGELSNPACFNQPLCSVIRGENGRFASVYYSIFTDAIPAKVCVSFLSRLPKNPYAHPFSIGGMIVGRYSDFRNAELYGEGFYDMILFSKTKEDVEVSSLPYPLKLSKSLLSVPTDSSLVLVMDLQIKLGTRYKAPFSYVTQEFKPYHNESIEFDLVTCVMTVSVEWGEMTCNEENEEMEATRKMLWSIEEV